MTATHLEMNERAFEAVTPAKGKYRLPIWCVAATLIVGGSLWYGFGRGEGISRSQALAACAASVVDSNPLAPIARVQPAVVGLSSSQSLAAVNTADGWKWCYKNGGGGITSSQLSAAVGAIGAVLVGGPQSDVLMLVHLNAPTTTVVVDTATSRSIVISRGGGFEVLRIPMAKWPQWHVPWGRFPVALGRILGFDGHGQVTSSQPFTWCPGSIDTYPGSGC